MFDPLETPQPEGFKGKLQHLASLIPGYGGYMDRDARRDADKLLRQRAAGHLGEAISQIQHLSERLSRELKLDAIGPADRALNRVRTIQAKCEHADYGMVGLFSQVELGSEELTKVYEHDLELLNLADAVVQKAHAAATAAEDGLTAAINEVDAAVQAFENHLTAREHLLSGRS